MFGKLIKYEMKSMLKVFLLAWGAILVVALLIGVMVNNSVVNRLDDNYFFINNFASFSGVLEGASLLLYIALVVGIMVLSLIFVISRFNKGLLGSEGYLMFTLPTTPRALIISKGIAATLIVMISGIVGILSVVLIAISTANLYEFREVFQIAGELIKQYPLAVPIMILGVIVAILTTISFIYHVYTSIAVGHLFSKHRNLMAVVAFIVISIIGNVVASVAIEIWSEFDVFSERLVSGMSWDSVSLILLVVTAIWEIISIVIYHVVTEYILKNKLNLE